MLLRERKELKKTRIQYQIFLTTTIVQNQKLPKNENHELELKSYPKKSDKNSNDRQ